MTALPDDVVSGLLQVLRTDPTLPALFASTNPTDPLITDRKPLPEDMVGGVALVLRKVGPYAGPGGSAGNTADGVRLETEFWADPGPSSTYEPGVQDRRIEQAWDALDTILYTGPTDQWWGTVHVIGVDRLVRPTPYEVPDSGGLYRATAYYGVSLG